jgi:hypothetical protein
MKAQTAFIGAFVLATIWRIIVGVLLLTAQTEMTTLGLRWIFVLSGLWMIAFAIIRAVKGWVAFDTIFRNK